MKKVFIFVLFSVAYAGYAFSQMYDVKITNASVFNTHTKTVELNKTIVIDQGKIIDVLESKDSGNILAHTVIDAENRLVTPGLIDAHFHRRQNLKRTHLIGQKKNGNRQRKGIRLWVHM